MAAQVRGEIIRLAVAKSLGEPIKKEDYEKPLEEIARIKNIPHSPKSISMSADMIDREGEEFYKSGNKLLVYQPALEDIYKILESTYEIEQTQGKIQWVK